MPRNQEWSTPAGVRPAEQHESLSACVVLASKFVNLDWGLVRRQCTQYVCLQVCLATHRKQLTTPGCTLKQDFDTQKVHQRVDGKPGRYARGRTRSLSSKRLRSASFEVRSCTDIGTKLHWVARQVGDRQPSQGLCLQRSSSRCVPSD